MMHDYTGVTTPEMREADAREMLAGDDPPVRYNGPALYLWWLAEHERPEPEHGTWIVSMPVLDYDEAVVQVEWKVADPRHRLQFDLRRTLDPDYGHPKPGSPWIDMLPMLDQFDPKKSTRLAHPGLLQAENRMILRYRDMRATRLGIGLRGIPLHARADARIWLLLLGHKKAVT